MFWTKMKLLGFVQSIISVQFYDYQNKNLGGAKGHNWEGPWDYIVIGLNHNG